MDYLEIVLQGYFNENNREFLEKYFLREFKKAEKEQFFEADEFFNGCIKIIENWEKYLQDKVFERKRELYLMLNGAKNGTVKYRDLQGKTVEQKRLETIEYCEQELKDVRPDGIGSLTFMVHLYSLTKGRIAYNLTYNELLQIKLSILKAFQKTQPQNEALPPQPIVKQKPEPNGKLITFKNSETIDKIHSELKGYFPNKEAELLKALQGEQLSEFLLFPHNQNKFVEVFKRLKYNGFLLSTPKETKDWICSTFTYQYQKGNKKEVRKFNPSTVHDILTKDKGEPTKKERICIVDWLPYKNYLQLTREKENEKL
ncbi:MAG: hypothetical protein OHK0057_14960 [Thermoflexibacter sp.]